jgi:hypothetical protein
MSAAFRFSNSFGFTYGVVGLYIKRKSLSINVAVNVISNMDRRKLFKQFWSCMSIMWPKIQVSIRIVEASTGLLLKPPYPLRSLLINNAVYCLHLTLFQ